MLAEKIQNRAESVREGKMRHTEGNLIPENEPLESKRMREKLGAKMHKNVISEEKPLNTNSSTQIMKVNNTVSNLNDLKPITAKGEPSAELLERLVYGKKEKVI